MTTPDGRKVFTPVTPNLYNRSQHVYSTPDFTEGAPRGVGREGRRDPVGVQRTMGPVSAVEM